MRNKIFLLLLLIAISICSCSKDQELLIGKWERFGDPAEGSILKIETIPNSDPLTYKAQIYHATGLLIDLGFVVNDLKWKDIVQHKEKEYEGQDLTKAVDNKGEIQWTRYDGIRIHMASRDMLHVEGLVKSEEFGDVQKWRRID